MSNVFEGGMGAQMVMRCHWNVIRPLEQRASFSLTRSVLEVVARPRLRDGTCAVPSRDEMGAGVATEASGQRKASKRRGEKAGGGEGIQLRGLSKVRVLSPVSRPVSPAHLIQAL